MCFREAFLSKGAEPFPTRGLGLAKLKSRGMTSVPELGNRTSIALLGGKLHGHTGQTDK
jgi:hypothetical protein